MTNSQSQVKQMLPGSTEQGKAENTISWSWMQGHTPSAVSTTGLQPGKIRTSSPEV